MVHLDTKSDEEERGKERFESSSSQQQYGHIICLNEMCGVSSHDDGFRRFLRSADPNVHASQETCAMYEQVREYGVT